MTNPTFTCHNRPHIFLANSLDGAFFHPTCQSYECPYCGWVKTQKLAKAIKEAFAYKRVRLLTLTTTNRYNDQLPDHLPVLAWRKLIKNLRNHTKYPYLKGLKYIRIVEYQKNGNTHFHILIDRFLSKDAINKLWRNACAEVLKENGIPYNFIERYSNANLVGDTDGRGAFKYVVKYLTKSVRTDGFRDRKTRRYRPYSASRNVVLFPKRPRTPGWYKFAPGDLPEGRNLYLFSQCLLPKEVDGKLGLYLTDPAYSALLGEKFDYG